MKEYEELLNTAKDFYNFTVGDPEVKISCKTANAAKKVELAGVRLRNSLRTMIELQKLDKNEDSLPKS